MKMHLLYFFAALFALSVQSTLFKGAKPDFVFILIFFYSLRYGGRKGMIFGALIGLLIDFSSGFILGPNIISKAFVGYLIPMVRQKLFQWNIIINTVMVVFFSVMEIVLIYVCLETFTDMSFVNRSLGVFVVQIVYVMIISMLVYPVLNPEKYRSASLKTYTGFNY